MATKTIVGLFTLGCLLTFVANSESSDLLQKDQFNIDTMHDINRSFFQTQQPIVGNNLLASIESCQRQPELQAIRSEELKKLFNDDQSERLSMDTLSREQWDKLAENDLIRRKRVGEIFGEGCITTAEDYLAASLIYQHGDISDHYYQAFMWAKHAVELGAVKEKFLVAMTIDRYLISTGKKQLFASQFYRPSLGACYCLQQVEESFPESLRKEYDGHTRQDALNFLPTLNAGKDCPNTECDIELQPSPKGTVPGFW